VIKRRPTLPTGFNYSALPAVRNALHVDERFELYTLETSGPATGLLLHVRSSEHERVARWLTQQDPRILTLLRALDPAECPKGLAGFALLLRGTQVSSQDYADAPQARLQQLLQAICALFERAQSLLMSPDLTPELTWELAAEGVVCTLLPRADAAPNEAEQVQAIARAFYQFATGSDPNLSTTLAPLAQWSKFSGPELSRIIERCLAPASPREQINTRAALARALGGPSLEAPGAQNEKPTGTPAHSASAFAQGMAKVAGMYELKELLQREVIGPLRDPEPYQRYGLSIPNGILLYGPPGCGKTYIARQLAEELGHYFVEVIPSELAGIYVHQSVIKIRELFDAAAEQAPAVVFIDEFEALVPAREQLGGHQQYKAEEVNEFLAQLNGCAERKIFIIAATNRPEKIDAAVRRTGRLDKLIYVGPPDRSARHDMLALHLEGRPVSRTLELDPLAQLLDGYSASDLRFLVDEAAREAFRNREEIGLVAFRLAMARVPPSVTAQVAAQYQSIDQRGN
jgi:hypothetical protein